MSVDEGESDSQAVIPKRRPWPVFVVAVVLFGAIAATGFVLSRRPIPLRVLIAIDVGGHWWEGSRPAALASEQLAARLERFGFEPVKSGDPEVKTTLEHAGSIEEASRKLRAGFVVSGALVPEVSEEPVPGGYFEARVDAPVALAKSGEAPVEAGRVASWSAATTKDKALEVIAESLADKVFDVLILALMAHPSIREISSGRDAAAKAPLLRAESYLAGRREKLERAEKVYTELSAKRAAGEKLRDKVSHHGSIDRVVALAGATKGGFVAKSAEIQRFVSPDSGELGYAVGADRIYVFVFAEPGGERVLFSGHPIQGYPGVAPEGTPIAFVQDLLGRARVLSTLDETGRRTRVRVDDKRFFSEPKLSPGGRAVALWERACRGCPAGLLVIATAGGKELYRTQGEAAALGGFAWLGPERLALLERPKAAETKPKDEEKAEHEAGEPPKPAPQRIVLVELAAVPARLETIYTAGDEGLSAPSASRSGRLIALAREAADGKRLAVLDIETKTLTAFDVGAADNPQLSPSGELVAFEHAGDLAALELATGKQFPLTKNPTIERYPMFSLDGSRLFFEVRDDDPVFPRRAVSVVGQSKLR